LRNTGVFRGFSLFIIIIAGRNSEAAMGGTGAPSAPVLRVKEPKKTVARSARLRTCGQNPLGLEELSNSRLCIKQGRRVFTFYGAFKFNLPNLSC